MVSGLDIVQTGLLAYYRLHGQWPANWKQVEDDWLAGGKILSPQLQEIAPDDQVLDFEGDIVYLGSQPDGTALVSMLQDVESMRPYLLNLQAPKPYAQSFPETDRFLDNRDSDGSQRFSDYLSDHRKLKQFAMTYEFKNAIENFYIVHHRYPKDMMELLRSGLCALYAGCLNPMTNLPFQFDGSPLDLRYSTGRLENGTEWYLLEDLDENGEPSLVAKTNLY